MNEKVKKNLVSVLVIISVLLIVYFTLLTREPSQTRQHIFRPFYSYYEWLAHGNFGWAIQNFQNIILFVPFGASFYLWMIKNEKTIRNNILVTCVVSALLSLAIESVQYFFTLGFFETDDLINNTLGALIGSLLMFLAIAIKRKSQK